MVEPGDSNWSRAHRGKFTSGHEEGEVADGISCCVEERCPLFGRNARAGASSSPRKRRASWSLLPSVRIADNHVSAALIRPPSAVVCYGEWRTGTQNTEIAPQVAQPQKLKPTTWERHRGASGMLSRVESKPATEVRIKTSQSEAGLFISFLRIGASGLAAS